MSKKNCGYNKWYQIESSSIHCGMMKLSNNDNTYFNNPTRQFLLAALIGFGANLFVLSASAQDTISKIQQELQPSEQVIKIDSTTKIRGVLVDKSTKEPIPFANVYIEIEGLKYGVPSNIDGYFEIKLPFNLSTKKLTSVNLTISSISYKTVILTITEKMFNKTSNMGVIFLEEEEFEIIGIYVDPEKPNIMDPDNHRKTTIKRSDLAPRPPRK